MNHSSLTKLFRIQFLSICLMFLFCIKSYPQTCPIESIPITQTDLRECDPAIIDCLDQDLLILDAFLQGDDPFCEDCINGEEISMNINLNVVNQTENENIIGLFGELSNGVNSCDISICSAPLIPKSLTGSGTGDQILSFGPINYICGETLTISNILIVSADEGANCPLTCEILSTQCSFSIPELVMMPPVVPDACGATIAVACDDLNPCTINDTEIIDACSGAICTPCTGSGTGADCYVIELIPCDDLNPCTENDMQTIDACSGDICAPCTGTPVASCSVFINQACNDNDPCTSNDVIVLDACSLEICIPCTGTQTEEVICDTNCEVYNPSTCSCDPIPIPSCDDSDCTTIDIYNEEDCACQHIPVDPQSCDDGLCYTNDYFDPETCNCVNDPIIAVDCDDNDCATNDYFNYITCECDHIEVCNNVTNGGWIGYDQGNCGPFDPAPIWSFEEASGGCGDIEYMWLFSPINVPYYPGPNSPWTEIPNATGLTYDPGFQTQGTICYLRCARTSTCTDFPGESNVVCITVGEVQNCNDWNCTTEDYFNTETCECEYTVISDPSCDDLNCGTEDYFNPETCECEYTPVCNNVTFPGNISGNQESCGPFYPGPIQNVNLPSGGCGDIEYIWIKSHTNVFGAGSGGAGSPWSTIPGATGASYDPGYVSQTTYYRRCARSSGCVYYIGESNIICIEVTSSETCDDGNCSTLDTFDPITCECFHIDISPDCDDNNCSTTDVYDPLTCNCTHIVNPPVDCDDNDCNTLDEYDESICACKHTIITPPDCDDNDCSTTDLYDVLTCECVNILNPPVNCNDNDCSTIDIYNASTCACEYEDITLPDCNDNDCLTIDEYDPETCECTHTSIELDNCDDNDCQTHDYYDTINCECVYEPIPPPDCDDQNCNTIDSFNTETCLCENIAIEIPDCDDGNCNTEDFYDVTICNCVHTLLPPPNCDDDNCNTEDMYNEETCECVHTLIPPPDCDDNDCTTDDIYDPNTCQCLHTISQVPDCNDNNCNTEDYYDSEICTCVNELIPPPNCDDGDCNTLDSYNELTCTCVNEVIPPPNCDDNDCNTLDSYNETTCSCENILIPPPNCDDNDCTTLDSYDELNCECLHEDIPQEIICNTVGSFDLILDENGNGNITIEDIDDGSSIGCEGTIVLSLDITDFACNNIGENIVKLTVSNGTDSECCTAIVNVIDNTPPVLQPGFCPPDITINCEDDISDLTIYGTPNILALEDNCSLNYSTTEVADFDLDNCGIGSITRTFTLVDFLGEIVFDSNGQVITCQQSITVQGSSNPITLDDITWPTSLVNLDCSESVPDSAPIIDDSGLVCSNIIVSSSDEIINPDNPCDYSIERTFVVTDQCQIPPIIFEYTQIFHITDTQEPTINLSPSDLVLDLTNQSNECSTVITLEYNITDDCADSNDMIISLDAPGLIGQSELSDNGDISFDVEFCTLDEEVTVTLTVDDGCGNISTSSFDVMVLGGDCITYSCQKFIYALEDDGSNDFISNDFPVIQNDCGHIDVNISYDPMDIQDTLLTLGCDEIIANGTNPNINQFLYFWVDGELIDSCRIVVFFSDDPNGDGDTSDGWAEICGLSNLVGTISGTVSNIMSEPVSNVEINLEGSLLPIQMTDENGEYAFPLMELGANYEVIPKKDDDYLNGVSTLDIILIQKHILNIKEFNSPYKHIAGDVNKSNSVSSLDIIILRKLILGIYDDFPNNTSWRMIDKQYNFTDFNNPLASPIAESNIIENMPSSMVVEFVGVKIGDVNGSVVNEFTNISSELRSDNKLEVGYDERYFQKGDEFEITFKPAFGEGFDGTQFALQIDSDLLEVEDLLLRENALCTIENFNLNDIENGLIKLSYNSLVPLTSSDKLSLFTLRVKAKTNNSVSRAIKFEETNMKAESYFYDRVGKVSLMPQNENNGGVILYQNKPNPWNDETTIQYFVPQDKTIGLKFYTITGQVIRSETIEAKAGINDYKIDGSLFNTTGIFYYELTADGNKQVRKMLILD